MIENFLSVVNSDEAKEGLKIADELADIICFHARTRENAEAMMRPMELKLRGEE